MADATSFRALYMLHAPHVRRFVLYLTGDQDLADEVTSETFARAWTVFGAIRQETLRAYLFTIARNLVHDVRRQSSRYRLLSDDLSDDAVSPQQLMEDRSELDLVFAAMAKLPEADRAALLMRADGISYEDIARSLGLGISAAKVRVHRARMKLMRAPGIRNANSQDSEEI